MIAACAGQAIAASDSDSDSDSSSSGVNRLLKGNGNTFRSPMVLSSRGPTRVSNAPMVSQSLPSGHSKTLSLFDTLVLTGLFLKGIGMDLGLGRA